MFVIHIMQGDLAFANLNWWVISNQAVESGFHKENGWNSTFLSKICLFKFELLLICSSLEIGLIHCCDEWLSEILALIVFEKCLLLFGWCKGLKANFYLWVNKGLWKEQAERNWRPELRSNEKQKQEKDTNTETSSLESSMGMDLGERHGR